MQRNKERRPSVLENLSSTVLRGQATTSGCLYFDGRARTRAHSSQQVAHHELLPSDLCRQITPIPEPVSIYSDVVRYILIDVHKLQLTLVTKGRVVLEELEP